MAPYRYSGRAQLAAQARFYVGAGAVAPLPNLSLAPPRMLVTAAVKTAYLEV